MNYKKTVFLFSSFLLSGITNLEISYASHDFYNKNKNHEHKKSFSSLPLSPMEEKNKKVFEESLRRYGLDKGENISITHRNIIEKLSEISEKVAVANMQLGESKSETAKNAEKQGENHTSLMDQIQDLKEGQEKIQVLLVLIARIISNALCSGQSEIALLKTHERDIVKNSSKIDKLLKEIIDSTIIKKGKCAGDLPVPTPPTVEEDSTTGNEYNEEEEFGDDEEEMEENSDEWSEEDPEIEPTPVPEPEPEPEPTPVPDPEENSEQEEEPIEE